QGTRDCGVTDLHYRWPGNIPADNAKAARPRAGPRRWRVEEPQAGAVLNAPVAAPFCCRCLRRIGFSSTIARSAVSTSMLTTTVKTAPQEPVLVYSSAATGPPRMEPTPCAMYRKP